MTCPPARGSKKVELADILRAVWSRMTLTTEESTVVRAIVNCRTPALGSHAYQCDSCGHKHVIHNPCDNRHCPKCQALAKARWLEKRLEEVLPVPYFHIVFTLPSQLNPIALGNRRTFYALFFKAVGETLLEAGANPDNLGAEVGVLAMLHTWGQDLGYHPHIHCVVPGGGISEGEEEWIPSPKGYFICVKKLSRLFRGKFLAGLKIALATGKISAPPEAREQLNGLHRAEWVVYAKEPFGGPAMVLDYLGRYLHRVAISNNRILAFENDQVTFAYRDYRTNSAKKMVLPAEEFARRFLLHLLPRGFTRVRYFGFMANRIRRKKLAVARRLLWDSRRFPRPDEKESWKELLEKLTGKNPLKCPNCENGTLKLIARLSWVPP